MTVPALVGAFSVAGGLVFVLWVYGQNLDYATPSLIPMNATPISSPGPQALPAAVRLKVPYTTQAPLADWSAKQHTCEVATLVMVDWIRPKRFGDPQ